MQTYKLYQKGKTKVAKIKNKKNKNTNKQTYAEIISLLYTETTPESN